LLLAMVVVGVLLWFAPLLHSVRAR
jgi:hypothetical protein